METATKTYNTRRKRNVEETQKSRVDWKRTKRDGISVILDSDESCTSEEEELEETQEESDDGSSAEESEDRPEEGTRGEEDGEEGCIRRPRLKNTSTMIDSDSSSDSDGPGERVNTKRSCVIKDDDSDEGENEETEALKKQKRLEKLNALAQKRRSRSRTTSHEAPETPESPADEYTPLTPETPAENEDSDNMSDFIVEDGEENNGDAENPTSSYKDLFRKHHISLSDSHDLSSHLQKVIKAFLINIIDKNFLTTLYDGVRKKRYAKDMLQSLNHLDDRIIGPRLEKLTTSCRWTKKYKERIDSYPILHMKHIPSERMSCEACQLHRTCSYLVTLSGQAYDSETLEADDFLQDDTQKLVMGTVCFQRTEAYHQLRHYKYCLYRRCIPFINETKEDSANEIVQLALLKMEKKKFLKTEVLFLEGYLNEADYFQDESKDSLFS